MKKYHRSGILAKKMGVTSLMRESGEVIPVTILSLEGCCVVHAREEKEAGRVLLQIGSGVSKRASKPLAGHFKQGGVDPRKVLRTFCVHPDYALPKATCFRADYFPEGAYVDVSGTTIGRGFAGVMKRHGFKGLRASHGVSVSHRSHGSTGQRTDPGRVFKGKKMAGHMGSVRRTVQNLEVVSCDVERGLVFVKGNNIPGFEGGWVSVQDAVKKQASSCLPEHGVSNTFEEKEVLPT
jgi:large subunit ribosomal protein L3